MIHVVVDLGFGDSGKGAIVDRLAALDPRNTLVVRYTGGSQAGHHVVIGDKRHVHSSFASGALAGVRSHISAFCPISPTALVAEGEILQQKNGLVLRDYCSMDPLCPLITWYDREFNRYNAEMSKCKDTVGMGVGATMKRHEVSPYRIFAVDLEYPDLLRHKLDQIKHWYLDRYHFHGEEPADYASRVLSMREFVTLIPTNGPLLEDYQTIIFEGAQGVLLDRDHGFFPDVTYGHTTMRNAMTMVHSSQSVHLHYVTRSYHTRHGDGHMGNGARLNLIDETNGDHGYQGVFRSAELDLELLNYALLVNESYANHQVIYRDLHITCVDRHHIDHKAILSLPAAKPISKCTTWFGADRYATFSQFHS